MVMVLPVNPLNKELPSNLHPCAKLNVFMGKLLSVELEDTSFNLGVLSVDSLSK